MEVMGNAVCVVEKATAFVQLLLGASRFKVCHECGYGSVISYWICTYAPSESSQDK